MERLRFVRPKKRASPVSSWWADRMFWSCLVIGAAVERSSAPWNRQAAVVTVGDHLRRTVVDMGLGRTRCMSCRGGLIPACSHRAIRGRLRRRLGLPIESPMLLWVGRLVPVKGLSTLFQAWAPPTLRDAGTSFRLCLIGDGPLRASLERASQAANLSDRISFLGHVSPQQPA